MSRVGKKPIPVPDKTKMSYTDRVFTIEGEKGKLSRTVHPSMDLEMGEDAITVAIKTSDRNGAALQGLTRSLIANMVIGVTKGFERKLEINGIGYRASVSGRSIEFNLGYSHPIKFDLPDGITAEIEGNTAITLIGIDKEILGHTAAAIRRLRPPEPYKGKGIKYAEEHIRRKAGKTATAM